MNWPLLARATAYVVGFCLAFIGLCCFIGWLQPKSQGLGDAIIIGLVVVMVLIAIVYGALGGT